MHSLHLRPHYTPRRYRCGVVSVCVCLLVTTLSCAITAEQIDMPFGCRLGKATALREARISGAERGIIRFVGIWEYANSR